MTVDVLIVYNMLLTGFDAPRLKRLYFGRKLKDHNLLQAITRVNRPYGDNKYGYVIDFADIKQNFDETNEAYMKELNRFNDPAETGMSNLPSTFAQVIEDKESLVQQMKDVRQTLFNYSTDNVEEFSLELSSIDEKEELLKLKKALISARDCYNMVRTFGDDELKETLEKLKIEKVSDMINAALKFIKKIINERIKAYSNSKTGILYEQNIRKTLEIKLKWKISDVPLAFFLGKFMEIQFQGQK